MLLQDMQFDEFLLQEEGLVYIYILGGCALTFIYSILKHFW